MGEGCYWYRDRDGFCHLTNRCWAGRACPATQEAADRARDQLVAETIRSRDAWQNRKITKET